MVSTGFRQDSHVPRVTASWFPGVAQSFADGTPLPEALQVNGITLDGSQTRALYRTEEFRKLYDAACAAAADDAGTNDPEKAE